MPDAAACFVVACLEAGVELEDVLRELCFLHRRAVQEATKVLQDEWINTRDDQS